jgi:hypothetical protein
MEPGDTVAGRKLTAVQNMAQAWWNQSLMVIKASQFRQQP